MFACIEKRERKRVFVKVCGRKERVGEWTLERKREREREKG